MRQRADADPFHSGLRDRPYRLQIDASGRLQLRGDLSAIAPLHGFTQLSRRHIIEQDNIGLLDEHLVELFERIDFHFDNHFMSDVGEHLCQRLASQAYRIGRRSTRLGPFGHECQMVVLDQHGVEQAGTMIAAATTADRIFLEAPPTGSRLARIVNPRSGPRDSIDVLPSERGDSRQSSDQVEQKPFGGEQISCRPGDGG